jgi:hypothetical protein
VLVAVLAVRLERYLSPAQNGLRDTGPDPGPGLNPATAARASPG